MYRSIHGSLWTDPDARKLSTDARYLFLYLLTNPHSHVSGLYYLPAVSIPHETGLPPKRVAGGIAELRIGYPARFIADYDDAAEVVFVRRMFRHQAGSGKGDKLIISAGKQLEQFQHSRLAERFAEEYPQVSESINYTPSIPLREGISLRTGTETGTETGTGTGTESLDVGRGVAGIVPDHLNGQTWGTPLALAALWNELSPPECLNVVTLAPSRVEKARKYLKMFPEQDWWRETFGEVAHSRFLRGLDNNPKGDHKNFRASFDWFLQRGQDGTENCVKAYEGRYRDGR